MSAHPEVNLKNINAVRELVALMQTQLQEQTAVIEKQSLALSTLTTRVNQLQTEIAFLRVTV